MMSIPQRPKPAKLIVGLFMREKGLFHSVVEELADQYGNIDLISPWFPFDFTTYYEPEMGAPLFRRMASFRQTIEQNDLPGIKRNTNRIESNYSTQAGRAVNIDPGYITHERLVLATGKNFTHRIYLDEGIYADLTLIFQKGAFRELPWTYPDYREKNILDFITQVRKKYVSDLKFASQRRQFPKTDE